VPEKTINNRCPYLSRECANPHHCTAPRSHRQHSGVEYRHYSTTGTGGGALRELATDWIMTRISSSASSASSASSLLPLSSAAVYNPVLGKHLRSVDSQPFFPLPRYQMPACVPPWRHRPISNLPACTSNSCATRPGGHASTSIYFPLSLSPTCISRHFSICILYTC
jgi:hypothetical protein